MRSDTLRMTDFNGKVPGFAMALLILLIGMAEWITRSNAFQAPLTPPKMGSRHYQLGHKLSLLEQEVRRNGPIDCIMMGSSMVDVGFNPDVMEESYQRLTGRNIRCFNFGIDASSAASTRALMKILMEDFRPRFMIFGTDPRDYALPSNDSDPAAVLDTPWVQYRQGDFSLQGWLLDNSCLFRYRQHLSRLLHFRFEDTLWSETELTFPIDPNGYTPITKISTHINERPDPADTSYEVTYYSRIYSHYIMLNENLAALEQMMDYNDADTQVILVEMPVSDGLYFFFGNGEKDYTHYVTRIGDVADQHQVPFWQTEPLDFVPDDGWSDYSHMNVTGADIFSSWLGRQVAAMDLP